MLVLPVKEDSPGYFSIWSPSEGLTSSYTANWMSTVGRRSRSLAFIFTGALEYFRLPVTRCQTSSKGAAMDSWR